MNRFLVGTSQDSALFKANGRPNQPWGIGKVTNQLRRG
jgi:hypothetical protein